MGNKHKTGRQLKKRIIAVKRCICGELLRSGESVCPSCMEDMDRVADIFDKAAPIGK